MQPFYIFFIAVLFATHVFSQNEEATQNVNQLLDQWHKNAAEADFDAYFNKMHSQSVFIGTDASEIWTKKQFQQYAKPHFDKKKAWSFSPLDRNIYFSENQKTVWFDEALDTRMGICRGSGVLTKSGNSWKIRHYVLSVTIPNEDMNQVIEVKKEKDAIQLGLFKNQN